MNTEELKAAIALTERRIVKLKELEAQAERSRHLAFDIADEHKAAGRLQDQAEFTQLGAELSDAYASALFLRIDMEREMDRFKMQLTHMEVAE